MLHSVKQLRGDAIVANDGRMTREQVKQAPRA